MELSIIERDAGSDASWWVTIDRAAQVGPFEDYTSARSWARRFAGEDDGRYRRGERVRLYTVQSAA